MAITMKEISRRAGVSRTAVSAVLNRKPLPKVSDDTRKLILALARENDYTPNRAAQFLCGKPTRTVALLYCRNSSALADEMLRQIAGILYQSGYQSYDVGLATEDEESDVIRELISRGIDGVITISYESRLRHAELPVPLLITSIQPDQSEIAIDLEHGGYLAGRHLLEHGHRRIAFLTSDLVSNCRKYAGLCRALAEAGIVEKAPVFGFMRNPELPRQLLEAWEEGVSGFFCSNDLLAGKFMYFAYRHGKRIPEELAVIGFDGLSCGEFTVPPLSTVEQPIAEFAGKAVNMLLAKINGQQRLERVENVLIRPKLHCLASCGCADMPVRDFYWDEAPLWLPGVHGKEHHELDQ